MVIPSSEVKMKFVILGFVLVITWILATFVAGVESKWIHTPLAIGTVMIAVGIVLGKNGEEGKSESKK